MDNELTIACQRMNYFDGFHTQASDWQTDQDYHLEKHQFHRSTCHTPGIVPQYKNELAVVATNDGTAILVHPGCAIDGKGRDLVCTQGIEHPINPQEYRTPCTIYITMNYAEEKVDVRNNAMNPQYRDYAFIREFPKVEILLDEPNIDTHVELARIALAKNASRIKDASNPEEPATNEIDRRHIRKAGTILGAVGLDQTGKIVKEGEIGVAVTDEESDTSIPIASIKASTDTFRYYIASVIPKSNGHVEWRIASIVEKGILEYRLFLKNCAKQPVTVRYQVYELHSR
ncbi:MAG: hypothetical protein NPIRA04_04870 [Nitrospirales bacterium]|nr:MAG: hypothetical protein NPIRA04_04870 [Nitrospirales bacterium]